MQNRLPSITGLALALLIALTSTSMALARGRMASATGSMVLCAGAGTTRVLVDAQGDPIEPVPICPDCAFIFFDFGSVITIAAPMAVARYPLGTPLLTPTPRGGDLLNIQARGPPIV